MKSESELRDELYKLGLVSVVDHGRFYAVEHTYFGITDELPFFAVSSFGFFNDARKALKSERKHVFSYKSAVIKSGERGAVEFLCDPKLKENKTFRKQLVAVSNERAKDELLRAQIHEIKGLPVVVPSCILNNLRTGEYCLVERLGHSLANGINREDFPTQLEFQETFDAYYRFNCGLIKKGLRYNPANGNVFRNLVRYPSQTGQGYDLLVTDWPEFERIEEPGHPTLSSK